MVALKEEEAKLKEEEAAHEENMKDLQKQMEAINLQAEILSSRRANLAARRSSLEEMKREYGSDYDLRLLNWLNKIKNSSQEQWRSLFTAHSVA